MRERGEELREAERRERLKEFLSRRRGLEGLMRELTVCSAEGAEQVLCEDYSLSVLPFGKSVALIMNRQEILIGKGRAQQKLRIEGHSLPSALAWGILDKVSGTLWVRSFRRVNGYNYSRLSWRLQQHLLSSYFPTAELGRTESLSVRLLPRYAFSPETFHELQRKHFSRAKAIIAQSSAPRSTLFFYFRPYLRQAKVRFKLQLSDGNFCTAEGDKVCSAKETCGKRTRRSGCYEVSVKLKDAKWISETLLVSRSSEFEVESEIRVDIERRCVGKNKKSDFSRVQLAQFLQKKAKLFDQTMC